MSNQLMSWLPEGQRPKRQGNDGAALVGTNKPGLLLPFKPFTLAEVSELSGVNSEQLHYWIDSGRLPLQRGDERGMEPGLNYMQAFAVFVGTRWLHEGAPTDRANAVVTYVGNITFEHMMGEFKQARFMVGLVGYKGGIRGFLTEITADMGALPGRLRLDKHLDEFLTQMDKLFPERSQG